MYSIPYKLVIEMENLSYLLEWANICLCPSEKHGGDIEIGVREREWIRYEHCVLNRTINCVLNSTQYPNPRVILAIIFLTGVFTFLNFLKKFIYLFLATLGLRCCVRAFSSCGEWGLLFTVVCRLLCGGFSCCGAQALGAQVSVVAACRLGSCGARA